MDTQERLGRNGLRPEEMKQLEERLAGERETLNRRLRDRRETLKGFATHRPDESDWASDSADQSLVARLVDRDAKLLIEVERAFRKIAAGTYGVCELTDEPIGFERLRIRPWTRHSLVAKERLERDRVDEGPESLDDGRAA
jgi:DnaK suppressor protein